MAREQFWGPKWSCKFSLYRAVRAPIWARALRLQPHQPHRWSGPDYGSVLWDLNNPSVEDVCIVFRGDLYHLFLRVERATCIKFREEIGHHCCFQWTFQISDISSFWNKSDLGENWGTVCSKGVLLKNEWCQRLRPNFPLFDPIKNYRRDGENAEQREWDDTTAKPVVYIWLAAAAWSRRLEVR